MIHLHSFHHRMLQHPLAIPRVYRLFLWNYLLLIYSANAYIRLLLDFQTGNLLGPVQPALVLQVGAQHRQGGLVHHPRYLTPLVMIHLLGF